jgi:hypothetical protein
MEFDVNRSLILRRFRRRSAVALTSAFAALALLPVGAATACAHERDDDSRGAVFVPLNGTGGISGFTVRLGSLVPLAGSTRSLGLGNTTPPAFLQSPAQIGFSRDGHTQIVTTTAHNALLPFPLDLGRVAPDQVIGVHVNAATIGFIPGPVPADVTAALTDLERDRLTRIGTFMAEGNGYFQIQATRPSTLGFALNDSPVGQLAWIVDLFKKLTHPSSALPEESVDRNRMLTNVMLYWLTGTGASSAHLYFESMHSTHRPTPSTVPTRVAAFAEDLSIRRFAELGNTIVHWSDFHEGGHVAAMERPDLLIGDIRTFTRKVR